MESVCIYSIVIFFLCIVRSLKTLSVKNQWRKSQEAITFLHFQKKKFGTFLLETNEAEIFGRQFRVCLRRTTIMVGPRIERTNVNKTTHAHKFKCNFACCLSLCGSANTNIPIDTHNNQKITFTAYHSRIYSVSLQSWSFLFADRLFKF